MAAIYRFLFEFDPPNSGGDPGNRRVGATSVPFGQRAESSDGFANA
jgi:hypothetical protein